ncbi:MAG: 4Fe-4S dicluster domain-containing protein [Nitrospinaceae bacterium]|nr:4Fe-4S dicluster domain-containing protein [Nitrospinaceae bacterium]MBT3434407.1 4Fe-4S dicluster domain-containing protein [Nitrospinaceae bacterium]MBT3822133.1 4Fe-4S dicluster domain-containing protein [Nitrospinaceae bacterium]MBT4092579.1 4Fe-4S dicluster domain-containing protein [Nitrospinaceae bacterium]MBT4430060.1 4Fe-4S dicluster domain-containing protein [Nitrospinaceae bacterium]
MAISPDKLIDRKAFFKEGPRALLRAFAEGAREERIVEQTSAVPYLRPPGAALENEFLELCCGVGSCAEVCPANAIKLVPRKDDPGRYTPIIEPSEAACVLCDELACMAACQSGALTQIPRREIRIGLARVEASACWSWAGIDPGCNYCADRCPVGSDAIRIEKSASGHGPVVTDNCVGCGVCEYFCPAHPAAIQVMKVEI